METRLLTLFARALGLRGTVALYVRPEYEIRAFHYVMTPVDIYLAGETFLETAQTLHGLAATWCRMERDL